MKLLKNQATERVIDALHESVQNDCGLDVATSSLSVFAGYQCLKSIQQIKECRLILPKSKIEDESLLGSEADRQSRNQLLSSWMATELQNAKNRREKGRERCASSTT
jgi:hypothetical protein